MGEEAEDLEVSQVPEETEFDEAFAEIAASKESPEELDETPTDNDDEEAAEAADEIVAEGAGDDKDKVETSQEEEETAEIDPYEGMSPAVKAHWEAVAEANAKLNHQISSDAGRVRAFQLKVDGLETQIQQIREGATTGEQPSDTQISDAMKGTDDEWAQFSEDYPEVARAIDNRVAAIGEAADKTVNEALAPVKANQEKAQATEAAQAAEARIAAVAEVFPTWTTAVQTPEFKTWLSSQPPGIQALGASDDTDDASSLIGMYDNHLVAAGQPSLKAPEQGEKTDPTEPGVNEDEQQSGDEPTSLASRRAQQLEDGTSIPSKSAGVNTDGESGDDEFERAFEHHAKKKDRQRAMA